MSFARESPASGLSPNSTPQGAWEGPEEDDQHVGWARESFNALKPFSSGAAYVSFLTEEEAGTRLRAAYGAALYDRLRRIKTAYDPENLFRGNLNIPLM